MPFVVVALLASAAAAAGSLYLSLGMGLTPCTLCFYQRAFAFGLVSVLAVGLLAFPDRPARLCLVGLPLALGGLGVAGFHVYLGVTTWPRANATWDLVCPKGVGGTGTAPEQSLVAFLVAAVALVVGGAGEVRRTKQGGAALLMAWVLGIGAAVGSLIANPEIKPVAADPAKPPTTCVPTLR